MKIVGIALLGLWGLAMMGNYVYQFLRKPPLEPDSDSPDGTAFHGDCT